MNAFLVLDVVNKFINLVRFFVLFLQYDLRSGNMTEWIQYPNITWGWGYNWNYHAAQITSNGLDTLFIGLYMF